MARPSPRDSTPAPTPATRVASYLPVLAATYPDAVVELDHRDAYQLLCATILAAQSTDKKINTITPTLFARWPDATALAGADPAELEQVIHASGFFRAKARSLLGMARAVVERHGGEIPRELDALVALPGVGRKTANVVRGAIWGLADGIIVDTHVTRLAARLGLTRETEAEKIEQDLMAVVPREHWITFANRLIWHGRRVCHARQPACASCPLAPVCPSAEIGAAGAPASKTARAAKPATSATRAKPATSATRAKPATSASRAKPATSAPPARPARSSKPATAATRPTSTPAAKPGRPARPVPAGRKRP